MAGYSFHTLDVFTATRFGGNQLAVVLDADGLSDEDMLNVTREFNFSETTFVCAPTDPTNAANVRIFTPGGELPFAGHPTIGTAVLLARLAENDSPTEIKLEEVIGLVSVTVELSPDGPAYGTFTAPALPGQPEATPEPAILAAALQIDEGDIGFERHAPAFVSAGGTLLCIPVSSLDALAAARLDMARWNEAKANRADANCYVYTRGGGAADADFRARLFAPDHGVAEDPATGSAAAIFPGQIMAQEQLGDGNHSWRIEQGYEMGRPSKLDVHARVGGGAVLSVRVGGHAVEVTRGVIEI